MVDYQYFTRVIKSFLGRKEGGMMRRRMMMGRETPIQYLKRIGCKLWLPLNSEYGLKAAIGDTRIVNVVSNAVTINTSVDMGEFRLGNVDVPVATLTTDWTSADFPNDEWTMFSQGRRYANSNYRGNASIFKFPTIETGKYRFVQMCFNENLSVLTTNWTNNKTQTAISLVKNVEQSSMSRKLYWCEDGGIPELKLSDVLPYQDLYAVPYTNKTINIACHTTLGKRVYLKNVMIFNRHLTEDEMQKVLEILQQR